MSPDLFSLLTLIVKMAITAGFVVAATVTAERVGPLLAGLVATLPIGAGPVYAFLALDHDAHFIAQGALGSLVINAVNVIFAVTYARLAQTQSRTVSIGIALLVWLVLAIVVHSVTWNFAAAAIMNLIVFAICLVVVRPLRHVRVKGSTRGGPILHCAPGWLLFLSASSSRSAFSSGRRPAACSRCFRSCY